MTTGLTPEQRTGSALPAFSRINDTALAFGASVGQPRGRHLNPLAGLLQHGPYAPYPTGDKVRVATIATVDQQQKLFDFLKRLHHPARATDRAKYVPTSLASKLHSASASKALTTSSATSDWHPTHPIRATAQLGLHRQYPW
jgi:hypothetical protein